MAINIIICQIRRRHGNNRRQIRTYRYSKKKIRNEHNIEPGTQVRIEEKDNVIILIPVRGEHNLQSKDGVLVYTGVAMGDIGEAVSKHREKRARSVGKLK